ncbi:hypothetical protein KV699_08570 [Vreelandella titanicae]|uniref:hypothetical protein n=1 Tax=Vreelandella titanicae TaxID=664683 RepID=UPI003BAEDA9B
MIKKSISRLVSKDDDFRYYDVILHVGAPKTGSSALQRFCNENHKNLKSLGFYYPDHPLDKNGVSGGHTQIAGALIQNNYEFAKERFDDFLETAKSKNLTLLLSAEAFYGQHKNMASLCHGLNVKIVGFLRHPLDYLLGNHNQGIKRHMMTKRLNQVIPEMLNQPMPHLVGIPFCHWADEFGDENCSFLPYQAPDKSKPLEVTFLRMLGIDERSAKRMVGDVKVTNRSYVQSALEVKRLLNTVLVDLPESFSHNVDWCLQGYSDRALDERPYEIADIPKPLMDELSSRLSHQMSEVKQRFPELAETTTMPSASRGIGQDSIDLLRPLKTLRDEIPKVFAAIVDEAERQRDKGRDEYAFLKLLDYLNIDFNEPSSLKNVLPGGVLKTLASSESESADYLREIALMLERLGYYDDALLIINLANEKRPSGKGIIKIKDRIENMIYSKGSESK